MLSVRPIGKNQSDYITMKKQFVYLERKSSSHAMLEVNDVGYISQDNGSTLKVIFMRISQEINISSDYVSRFDIHRTGDEHDFKVCDRCFKRLPTATEFSDNRIKKYEKKTKRPSCKSCRKQKDGKSISKKDREHWDLKKPVDYTPFTCPICNKTTIAGLSKIVLDHCHKTGQVRGYLCESCNTGIGRFDDESKLVHRAADWLDGKIKP